MVAGKIEGAIDIARRLRPLNVFITETLNNDAAGTKFTFAVKDCYSTRNIKTSCGSRMLDNYMPPYTATVVEKLLVHGGYLLGKTNLDEFCMGATSTQSHYGPVKNPWTLEHWRKKHTIPSSDLRGKLDADWLLAGGSSGGSAVAVAAGAAMVALGSDTGGSTRNPAALCGVVGLKPTYGLLSRHGLIPLVNSLDVAGIFSGRVKDAAWAMDMLAGHDPKDSTSVPDPNTKSYASSLDLPLKGLKIGIPHEYHISALSQEVLDVWNVVAGWLQDAGCEVRQVSLPHTKYSIVCYHVLGECEIASNMARYDGVQYGFRDVAEYSSQNAMYASSRHQALNEIVRRRILVGNYFLLRSNYQRYFVQAMKVRRLIVEDFRKVFRESEWKCDLLLTPVVSTDGQWYSEFASEPGEGYDRERIDDYFTQPVNMAGLPAVSVPIRRSHRNLPIGLQLIADNFEDRKLLAIANWIEKKAAFEALDIDKLSQLLNACNDVP